MPDGLDDIFAPAPPPHGGGGVAVAPAGDGLDDVFAVSPRPVVPRGTPQLHMAADTDRPPGVDEVDQPTMTAGSEVPGVFGRMAQAVDGRNSDSLVSQAVDSPLGEKAAELSPWLMGPVGQGAASLEGARERYGSMRANGYGPVGAFLGGAAQFGLNLFAPKIAGAAVGKTAAALGAGAASRLGSGVGAAAVGGALTHGALGAATGETLSAGSAGISAATGDLPRAEQELRGLPESGAVLGGLGLVFGAAGGAGAAFAGRPRLAPRSPPKIDLEQMADPARPVEPAAAPAVEAETRRTQIMGSMLEPAAPPEALSEAPVAEAPEAPAEPFVPQRVPLAPGVKLNDPSSLRMRAEAARRGELDQPAPDANAPTPIMGHPVLPDVAAEAAPIAAPEPLPETPAVGPLTRPPGEQARATSPEAARVQRRAIFAADPANRAKVKQLRDAGVSLPAITRLIDNGEIDSVLPKLSPPIAPSAQEPTRVGGAERARADRSAILAEGRPAPLEPRPAAPLEPTPAAPALASGVEPGGVRPRTGADVPRVEPIAHQRATSTRPDLAIPSEETANREAFQRVDAKRTAAGEPEVRTRESQRKAAEERMRADPQGEAERAAGKVERGEGVNEQELHILKTTGDRHMAAGNVVEGERHYELYRAAHSDAARTEGYGGDPLEAPGKRAQKEVQQRVLAPSRADQAAMDTARRSKDKAKYDALLKKHLATVEQHRVEVAKKTGIDPLDLAQEKTPRKKTAQERVQTKIADVDRELVDLVKRFKGSFSAKSSERSTPAMGGEQIDLLTKIIANRVQKGVLKAADMALVLAKMVPQIRTRRDAQEAFKRIWNSQHASPGDRVEDVGALFDKSLVDQRTAALEKLAAAAERHLSGEAPEQRRIKSKDPEIQAILDTAKELDAEVRQRQTKPSPSLEQRIGAARDRLASAVERHAEAMGQTDTERSQTLAGAAAKRKAAEANLPSEVKALLAEVKRLGDETKKRDSELPKTLDEKLANARDRLERAKAKHAEAMGQTPEERLAAMEKAAAEKQPEHPEVEAIHEETKALEKQVKTRDRLILRNALRVLDASKTLKADGWDKFDEAFRNGLHTSFGLPWYKVSADAVNQLHHFITDDFAAALINHIIPGGKDPRSLTDIPYILKAIIPSLRKGGVYMLEGTREDRNTFTDEMRSARAEKSGKGLEGLGEEGEFHQQAHALSPVLHNVTGWNMRLIQGIQTGAEATVAHLQVAAEAHRLAFDENGKRLTGEALQKHMAEQLEDLASPAWTNAHATARRTTSVEPHKHVLNPVYWINRAKNANLRESPKIMSTPGAFPVLRTAQSALKTVAPFTVVPTNLVLRGVYGMTPLNGASIAVRTVRAIMHARGMKGGAEYARAQLNTDLARHALGWLTVAGIQAALYDDKGKRRITGYSYNPQARDQGQPPPHSVLVDGKWWDYSKMLGAGAHAVGLVVDALDAVSSVFVSGKAQKPAEAAKEAASALKEHLVDETFLRSVGDLVAAGRSGGGFAKYVGMLASSFVPTEVKQVAKSTQDTQPDRRVREKDFAPRVAQVVRQQLGLEHTPSVDLFGTEVPKDDLLNGPVTAAAARLFAPLHGRTETMDDGADPYRRMIMRWNDKNPGAKFKQGTPEPAVKSDGITTQLTAEQYHEFCVEAGKNALRRLQRAGLNTENPSERDMIKLKDIISAAQSSARDRLKNRLAHQAKAGVP